MGNERAPWAKRRSEQRKRDAELRYDLEMKSRKAGWETPLWYTTRRRNC